MDNLAWGVQITVLGMGLVFALLILLWGLLTLVSLLDQRSADAVALEPVQLPQQHAPADEAAGVRITASPVVNGMPADLVAAILVATLTHRSTLRRQAAPFMRASLPGSQLFASRWVDAGRFQQNHSWHPKGK